MFCLFIDTRVHNTQSSLASLLQAGQQLRSGLHLVAGRVSRQDNEWMNHVAVAKGNGSATGLDVEVKGVVLELIFS